MFKYYQPNTKARKSGEHDCAIRAICGATGKTWVEAFDGLCTVAREIQGMPDDMRTIKKYLKEEGWIWIGLKIEKGKKRPTVESFSKYNSSPKIVSCAGHLVCCSIGKYWDTYDSGPKSVYGYWYNPEKGTHKWGLDQ